MSLLADLMVKGACVRLETRQWTGKARLGPEHFGFESVDDDIVVLPQGYLIPKERVLAIDNVLYGARRAVQRYSVGFPIPDVYFVTVKSFGKLQGLVENFKEQLFSQVGNLVADWKDLRETARGRWEKWLVGAYSHLPSKAQDELPVVTFVERGIAALERNLPTKDSIKDRFKISLSAFQLSVPTNAQGARVGAAEMIARLKAFEAIEGEWDVMVKDFAVNTAKVLRQRVIEAGDRVSRVLKDGILRKPTIDLLRDTAAEIKDLNFLGDADLNQKLDRIANIARGIEVAAARDDDKARNDLAMALDGVIAEIKSSTALAGEKAAEMFGGLGKRAIEM